MRFPPPDYHFLRFGTDEYPAHQRLEAWRNVLSQLLLKVDLKALSAEPFRVEASLRALTGIRFGSGYFTPSAYYRTRELAAEDNDDLLLIVNLEGPLSALLDGNELVIREGDGCLLSCTQVFDLVRHAAGKLLFARIERNCVRPIVPNVDQLVGQTIPRSNEGLAHFTTFLRKLDERQPLESEELRRCVVAHAFNVLSLVLNSPAAGVGPQSRERPGVTRLSSIQKFVTQNLADQDISVASVAAANRLSPRQLQRLFEASGTTFSEFLLTERLRSVYAALLDAEQRERSVSDIALASGFGDVSYFNRAFRRHYGNSPSEVRRAALASPLATAG